MRKDARRARSSGHVARLLVRHSTGEIVESMRDENRVAVWSMMVRDEPRVLLASSRSIVKSLWSANLRPARAAGRGEAFWRAGLGWLESWRARERLRPVRARKRIAGRARGQWAARGLDEDDALEEEDN